MEDYFERGLQQATGGDRDRLLVFYCLANCWMSWNAAKRALAIGYTHVAWYPDGTDGWARRDLPLQEIAAEPRARRRARADAGRISASLQCLLDRRAPARTAVCSIAAGTSQA